MPQTIKNKKDELVTRGILKFELKKTLGPYATKNDLKEEFDKERQNNMAFFASKQDLKEGLENLENKLNIKLDKVVTGTEKIYAKLEKKEQENSMHGYQHKLAEDRLADHDKRLEKIEKATSFAH